MPQGPRRALSALLGPTARPVRAAACDPLCSVPPKIVSIAVKFGVDRVRVNIKASSRKFLAVPVPEVFLPQSRLVSMHRSGDGDIGDTTRARKKP